MCVCVCVYIYMRIYNMYDLGGIQIHRIDVLGQHVTVLPSIARSRLCPQHATPTINTHAPSCLRLIRSD